jgi:hypothetical protein
MPTVEAAKEARAELERNIAKLLVGFKMETGLTPHEVRLSMVCLDYTNGVRIREISSVEVRVEL